MAKLKKMSKTIERIRKISVPILKKNGVIKASIFGSYARGDMKKTSDIDVLIEPPKGLGFGFIGIKLELEKKLGKKVDLLTYSSIHPYLKKYILEYEVRIL